MPNPNGTPANLVASHPANANAAKRGIWSPRLLEPRAQEIAAEIMAAPWASALDELAAVEIARICALIEAIDDEIASRGVTGRGGDVRKMIEIRLKASGRLQTWLDRFGLTPKGRADFAAVLASGESIADAIRRRREGAA